jgi:O-antigen/teichoic acid export membrane protein
LALAFGGLAILMVAVMWPLADFVLIHIPKFAGIAPLALPMSLQAAVYLVQLPFTAALRAMHRAKILFVQYVVFVAVSLTGLVLGAHANGLQGAAWGLTASSMVGLLLMVALYWQSLRGLGDAAADRFTADDTDLVMPPADAAVP